MLEKSCKTCGCPLFEVKGRTLCVVCAENGKAPQTTDNAMAPAENVAAAHQTHDLRDACSCGVDHDVDSCSCGDEDGGVLAKELAMTIHAICERIHNEKDANRVLTLMNAVKAGTEALEILCRL